jgi:U4/U6 small nuclear ribonucleoprotein PRP4
MDSKQLKVEVSKPTIVSAALDKQESIIKTFEEKRALKLVAVPVDPKMVKDLLRKLGEPVTLFGEKELDRRDRLKNCIIERDEKDIAEITGQTELLEMLINTFNVNQTKKFFTEGPLEVKSARFWLANYSIFMAKHRLKRQLNEKTSKNVKYKMSLLRFVYVTNDASELVDDRPVTCCAFNHDGSYIVTAGWTGFVKIWPTPNLGNPISFKAHEERITGLATNPNPNFVNTSGPAIATGSADKTSRLWTSKGLLLETLCEHEDRLCRVAFHPSGRFLGTTSYDQTWRLWDLGKSASVIEGQQKTEGVPKMLYEQEGHARPVYSIAFQCDGSLSASGGMDCIGRLWDLRTGRNIMNLDGHVKPILALDFSPNGYQIITGSMDNSCQVWDLRNTACRLRLASHNNLVSHVKYHPNSGEYFITAGYDGVARVWSADKGDLILALSGHKNRVMGVDIHPDRNIDMVATVGYDRTLKLWGFARNVCFLIC